MTPIRVRGHARKIVSEGPWGYKVTCICGWNSRGYEAIVGAENAHEEHKAQIIAERSKA